MRCDSGSNAQRIDLVVEQTYDRGCRPHRENVHERAAYRVFAVLQHRIDAAVASSVSRWRSMSKRAPVSRTSDRPASQSAGGTRCIRVVIGTTSTARVRSAGAARLDSLRDDVLVWEKLS